MIDCQEADGFRDRDGYVRVYLGGRSVLAHRLAWALHNGEDPAGNVVRHTCDNPPCVNPEHLAIGTHGDNMRDKAMRDRSLFGSRNPKSVLVESDIALIAKMRASGMTQKQVGEHFGVCNTTISHVETRRTWKRETV